MISWQQFQEMEKGTIFYVACAGMSYNLVVEKFFKATYIGKEGEYPTVLTFGGGQRFDTFMRDGNCCYLSLEEAKDSMLRRAKWKHDLTTESLKNQVANLQQRLEDHLNSDPSTDYVFLDLSDIEDEPTGGMYDD